ncbi:MAG: polysaccharide biosynthesis C-terminal domain-containing protein [Bacteroidetes bacterium]|nr:polysaccharide biosynthesis C-terminal domain-containing protein [Bacteroidota bacterium]
MGVIIRQGFKAAISNYIGLVLGFVSLFILFPLFFEPGELGAIRIFLELATILSAFALMGTNYSINRYFPYFKTKDQNHHGFFFWAFILPLVGYMILLFTLWLFGDKFFTFINPEAGKYKALLPVLLSLILIILYQNVVEVACANHGRTAVPNFMKEVVMRSLIIVSGTLFYLNILTFSQTVWAITICYFIAFLGSLIFLSKLTKITLKPDFEFIKQNKQLKTEIIKFTIYLFFSGALALVIPKIDFILISSIKKDLALVAVYSIGFYLATFIEVPKRTILQIAIPIISGHMKNEHYHEVKQLNKKNGTNQLIISGILFFMIWLNIDNLYAIMPKGDYYAQGKWVVFFIGLSKMIDALFSGNGPIIANSKFYAWAMITMILAAFFGILFNYILISNYGIMGGAISTILVMIIVNVYNLLLVQFKLKINPFEKNQLKLIAVLIVFFALSFTGNWLENPYLDSIVRSIFFGILLLIVLIKSNISKEFNQLVSSKLPQSMRF